MSARSFFSDLCPSVRSLQSALIVGFVQENELRKRDTLYSTQEYLCFQQDIRALLFCRAESLFLRVKPCRFKARNIAERDILRSRFRFRYKVISPIVQSGFSLSLPPWLRPRPRRSLQAGHRLAAVAEHRPTHGTAEEFGSLSHGQPKKPGLSFRSSLHPHDTRLRRSCADLG